jgi:hypothetical protein
MKKVVLLLFTGLLLTGAASAGQITIGEWDFSGIDCFPIAPDDTEGWGFEAVAGAGVTIIELRIWDWGQYDVIYSGGGIIDVSLFNCNLGGTDGADFSLDVPEDIFNHYLAEVVVEMPTTFCDYCPMTGGQEIYLSAMDWDFGNIVVDETVDWDITIHNFGDVDLEVSDISSDNPAFTTDWNDFRTTIPYGSPLTVTVTFAPTEFLDYSGILTITSDDPDESVLLVDLQGVGIPLPVPDINLSGYTHNYGSVVVGDSLAWELFIYNVGTGDLDITNIQSSNPTFVLEYEGGRVIVAPDDSLLLTITFYPELIQGYNGTLMIQCNDPDEPVVGVGLLGQGIPDNYPPTLVLPDTIAFDEDFGAEVDFSMYADDPDEDELILTGDDGVNIFVAIDGLMVTFTSTPEWSGEETLSFMVEDPDGETSTDDVLVVVNPVPEPDILISVLSWDFGVVQTGSTGGWDLYISNIGDADLDITDITIDNDAFDSDFTDTIVIAPYTSELVYVTFTPTEAIVYEGILTVVSNDAGGDVLIDLIGEGWAPASPLPFSLLGPADDSDIDPPFTLTWEETTDPDEGDVITYYFYLFGDEELTDTLMTEELDGTSYAMTTLPSAGQFWWNVLALDTNTDGTLSSETWSFNWLDAVNPLPNGVPEEFKITSLYPNPFNPEVTVVYGVPHPAFITASIYDMSGRLVAEIDPGYMQPGYQTFTWRPTGATGIYFLQMSSDNDWRETKRLIYLK